jgi:hypothetical protein
MSLDVGKSPDVFGKVPKYDLRIVQSSVWGILMVMSESPYQQALPS